MSKISSFVIKNKMLYSFMHSVQCAALIGTLRWVVFIAAYRVTLGGFIAPYRVLEENFVLMQRAFHMGTRQNRKLVN